MRSLLMMMLIALAACGAESATQALESDSGMFHVDLTLDPAEPASGQEVRATVEVMMHEDMSAVTSANVGLEPWMPMHNHGISDDVVVSEDGGGVYSGRFAFSMPGTWELRVDIDGDVATGTVEVQ